MMFETIGIAGLGLVGGSVALAVKSKGIAHKIFGYTRTSQTLQKATERGIIDRGFSDFDEFIKDAEFVILSAPISANIGFARRIAKQHPYLLFTDVGSTKTDIVRAVEESFPSGHRFAGSHPMAGSEKKGIDQASGSLFENKAVIITPLPNCACSTIETIEKFWQMIGGKPIRMDAKTHDEICTYTSHLPHLIAFLLVSLLSEKMDEPYVNFCVGAGFRDTTRIAASDHEIWSEIFLSNRKNMLHAIKKLRLYLDQVEKMIDKKDGRLLKEWIEKIRKIRSAICDDMQ